MRPRGWIVAAALSQIACTVQPSRPEPSSDPSDTLAHVAPIELEAEPAPRWVDVDLDRHSESAAGCAVEASGALWCWGDDPPTRVRGVGDARRVAMSRDRVCRIDGDGRVRCADHSGIWREVEGVEHAVELSVVESRACARQDDGALRCWEAEAPSKLVAEDVLAFSVEPSEGCALQARGEVLCWHQGVQPGARIGRPANRGRMPGAVDIDLASSANGLWLLDDRGRVFHAYLRDYKSQLEWNQIGEVADGVEIVAARFNVCVRTLAGTVLCHGENQYGQFGDASSSTPAGFATMIVSNAQGLASTDLRTCVRTLDELVCSGLDLAALDPPAGTVHQHTLEDLVAVSLAAAGDTTCAIDAASSLRCWGWGMLDPFEPHETGFGIGLAAQPTLVSPNAGSLLGIASHDNWMKWVGSDGRLRTAMWIGPAPDWSLTAFEPDPPISSGSPAVIRGLVADRVACTIEAGKPADVLMCGLELHRRAAIPGIDGPVAIATKRRQVCAIDRRARVACVAHPDLHEYPTFAPTLVPGVRKARAIAMTETHACAMVEGGRVLCWTGKSNLSWPGGEMTLDYEPAPVEDIGLADVVALVATHDVVCSLDGGGAVRCWTPANASKPEPGPELDEEVVELVAGSKHVCARDRTGAVTCWGDESRGQLGRIPLSVSLQPRALRFDDTALPR